MHGDTLFDQTKEEHATPKQHMQERFSVRAIALGMDLRPNSLGIATQQSRSKRLKQVTRPGYSGLECD